jgi:hypothetical protein
VKDASLDGQPNPHYVVGNEDLVTTRFFCVFPSNSNPVRFTHPTLTVDDHGRPPQAHNTHTRDCWLALQLLRLQIPYGLDLTAQLGTWLNQNYPTYAKPN